MHKKDLIKGLAKFVDTYEAVRQSGVRWKGQRAFANFLIYYLGNLEIPHDEKYDFFNIEPHLPELMVDAFERLRLDADPVTANFRKEYEEETGHEVPNVTDLGASHILDQGSAVQTTLGFMLREITRLDWVASQIDAYCNAQKYVLKQTFDKFLRLVYRRGLYALTDECGCPMSGRFGETELRIGFCGGRIMFTFARRKEGETIFYGQDGKVFHRLPYQEDSVSFVGDDSDPLCLSSGLQSVYADFRTALDLIEDVVKGWPHDANQQALIFKKNGNVSFI